MKLVTIAVVGKKKSGKTTAIEVLTRELTRRGYKVAVVKHVPEENFTIDTEGKDTWRFAQAGAKTIIALSSDEIATIEKRSENSLSLSQILQKCRDNDIVFLEGFKRMVAKDEQIQKVAIVGSAEEAYEALKTFEPILVFVGSCSAENLKVNLPCLNALADSDGLADIVEDFVKKRR